MIKKTILGFIILLVASCSVNYLQKSIIYNTEAYSKPDIGIETYATLGNPIIQTGNGYYAKVLIVEKEIELKQWNGKLIIKPGVFILDYFDEKYEFYKPKDQSQVVSINAFGEKVISSRGNYFRVSKDKTIGFVESNLSVVGEDVFINDLQHRFIDSYFIPNDESFIQEFIYLGKVDNIIKFSYREYIHSMIRDGFTTEVSYDLTDYKIIGYKNFEAEIIEATNNKIMYKIISGFNN